MAKKKTPLPPVKYKSHLEIQRWSNEATLTPMLHPCEICKEVGHWDFGPHKFSDTWIRVYCCKKDECRKSLRGKLDEEELKISPSGGK